MKKIITIALLALFVGAAFFAAAPSNELIAGDIVALGQGEGGGNKLKDATNGQNIQEVYARPWSCLSYVATGAAVLSGTSTVLDVETLAGTSADYHGPFLVKIQNTLETAITVEANATATTVGDATTALGMRLAAAAEVVDAGTTYTELLLAEGQYVHLRGLTATSSADYCVCAKD